MKALITGATGFIGSHLAEHLHAGGYDLRALIRKSSDTKFIRHLPFEYMTGRFDDVESMREAVTGVDVVFHVAGVVAARTVAGFFEGNQIATRNLLEACARYNPGLRRFVHVSSQTATGPATDEQHPSTEDAPFRPITTYGRSKAAAEQEVFARANDIPVTIVRPPAVYGPRDSATFPFFKTASRGFIPVIGFDRKVVSLVYVGDLVDGFIQAAESPRAVGEAYFISSEELYTWVQIGEATAQVLGLKKARLLRTPHAAVFVVSALSGFMGRFKKKPPVLDFEKRRDITAPFWICSVDKAKEHFGYRQQTSLHAGIERTIGWYREHKWM